MRELSGIDIVTRLYDLSDLPWLDRLMFSIMGQVDAAPVQIHIMLQRFSFIEVQTVRNATRELRQLNQASVTFHNWDYPQPFDLRVPLLNWGLEVAQGQYFMCLEVHDQLCAHACAALIARLRSTQAALALGSIVIQPVWWWGDVMLPAPEQDASAPLSIVMLDRDRVAIKDCVFRTSEPGAEISDFIQRLSPLYAIDTSCERDILALRQHPLSSFDL